MLGDADGNGSYSVYHAELIAEVSVDTIPGFTAFPLIDPVIIGDVNGDGSLTAFDATLVAQEAVGLFVPEIPKLPQPQLMIALSNGQLLISWPQCADGYTLECTTALEAQASWTSVTNTPVTLGNQQAVTVNTAGATRFYRLAK